MTNWHVEERLEAFLANEITEEERVFIESHLEVCPQCHKEFEILREMASLLDNMPLEDPGSLFVDNVMVRIQEELLQEDIRKGTTKTRLWMTSDFRNMVASAVAAFVLFQGISGVLPELPKYDSAITGYSAVVKVKVELWMAKISHSWNDTPTK